MADPAIDGLVGKDGESDSVPASAPCAVTAPAAGAAAGDADNDASALAAPAAPLTNTKVSECDPTPSKRRGRGHGKIRGRDGDGDVSIARGRGSDSGRETSKIRKISQSLAAGAVPAQTKETMRAEVSSVETEKSTEDKSASTTESRTLRNDQHKATDKWYKVHSAPHLGLGLKLGAIYAESDLVRRCKGIESKLATLKKALQKKELFEEIQEPKKDLPSPIGRARKDVSGPTVSAEKILRFISNQVVWYTSMQPHPPAKIISVDLELDTPYLVELVGANTAADGSPVKIFAKESELVAFDKEKDFARIRSILGSGEASTSKDSAPIPRSEDRIEDVQSACDFQTGRQLWICAEKPPVPAWQAKVNETIADGQGITICIDTPVGSAG